MLPKIFSTPRYREGICSVERDYLKVDKLWVGCKVRMIWHMDFNGIQVADKKTLLPSTASLGAMRKGVQQPPSVANTEGVVQSMKFKRETHFNEFYVKGVQTGRVYKVAPSKWNYMNWTVTTHLLACLLAMNMYDCQGEVLYHPPRHFSLSPIKPCICICLCMLCSLGW